MSPEDQAFLEGIEYRLVEVQFFRGQERWREQHINHETLDGAVAYVLDRFAGAIAVYPFHGRWYVQLGRKLRGRGPQVRPGRYFDTEDAAVMWAIHHAG